MIRFLFKGLIRDPNRSVFPVLVVTGGVMITVLFYCWILGIIGDVTRTSAVMDTGHVKIMTRAYREIAGQVPNDLALFGIRDLMAGLSRDYPDMDWVARIKFGGLLDFPDENGETRVQGPVVGMGIDLLHPESTDAKRLNLDQAIIRGRKPERSGEILISDPFAQKLGVSPGETATLISATANGGMAIYNFKLAGTIRFGIGAMDSGAMIADIGDMQYALDMADAAGEILGYFPDMNFHARRAAQTAAEFNAGFAEAGGEFSPVMLSLKEQNGLGEYLDMVGVWMSLFLLCFIGVMAIVLWNTGLMSGIRRYGEIGVRLAIGESKGQVYRSMISEAVLIGIMGSIAGTCLGIGGAYYLQEVGINVSGMMQGSTIMMPEVMRARIALPAFFIGFIPGLPATVLGAVVSGITIFKRETAQLFKELET